MNNTSCPKPNKELFEETLQPILYILVLIVGLVLNTWGMKSLLRDWKKLRCINILVLNLGLADMLYLLSHPFLIVYYLKRSEWIFGEASCKITRFCFNLNLYGSIGFITCISVYRYLAVVYPTRVRGKLTTTHSIIISVVVWIFVSAQSLPDMFYPKTFGRKKKCFDTTSDEHMKSYLDYSITWTFFGFCIPLLIIVGCYGHVTFVICHSNTMNKDQKRKIFKLLFLLIILFSLCYAPYHVFKNLSLFSRFLIHQKICPSWDSTVFIARQASRGLVSLSSALNPVVYLHVNETMGVQFRQLLQGRRQMFSCWFKPESSSLRVPQTELETIFN